MDQGARTRPWLPEPPHTDDTPLGKRENFLDFLRRSTLPEARTLRSFLRYNVGEIPKQAREHFRRELTTKWDSTFFELVVGRTLQLLDASIEVEEELSTRRKPDFCATFDDGRVLVEAISPEFDRELREKDRDTSALCVLIKNLAPEGFSIRVRELPGIGPNDSTREFKRKLEKEYSKLAATESREEHHIRFSVDKGECELWLQPREGKSRIITGPSVIAPSDAEDRIEYALKRKRRQVRNSGSAVVLAVNATWTADLEDFDRKLYGHQCEVEDTNGGVAREYFRPDGSFAKRTPAKPTYAGMLAYFVGFPWWSSVEHICIPDPVLYLHPRWQSPLPSALLRLQTRRLEDAQGITDTRASTQDLLSKLRPRPSPYRTSLMESET